MSRVAVISAGRSGAAGRPSSAVAVSLPPAARLRPAREFPALPRFGARAAIAAALMRRATARLPLRIAYPDGTVTGPTGPTVLLHRPQALLARIGADGLTGLGEAYQAGDFDADDLVAVLPVLAGAVRAVVPVGLRWLRCGSGRRTPRNTPEGARRNASRQPDESHELVAAFLDESMTFSGALFDTSDDLATAQHRKIDRLLDATGVRAGSRVLEIGTGWGSLAIRAAQRGATVLGVTLSAQQRRLALRRAAAAGVVDRVDVRLRDYREIETVAGGFDAVLSVEMVEAVGGPYWPAYAATLARHLAPGGRVGLQSITMPDERVVAARDPYAWMQKYVFPGGRIPSVPALTRVLQGAGLAAVDRLDFGADYARTLRYWRTALAAGPAAGSATGFAAGSAAVPGFGSDATFRRTWAFYLASAEAGFAAGQLDVCQLIARRAH